MMESGHRGSVRVGVWVVVVMSLAGCTQTTRAASTSTSASPSPSTEATLRAATPTNATSPPPASDSEPASTRPPGSTPVFLPTFRPRPDGLVPEALIKGVLTRGDDGCLRLGPAGPIAFWPKGYSAVSDDSGVVYVLRDGFIVTRTGDSIAATGGVEQPVPADCKSAKSTFSVYIAEIVR